MTGIRLKSIVKIPANIVGTDGVTVENSGGTVTIGIDPDLVPTGMEWRGNWNALTNYEDNDAVAHEGASYIAIADNLNSEPPSADWDVLAQAGSGTVVVDDQITPAMLDADTSPKQLAFRDRLNFVSREGDTMTGHLVLPTGPADSNAVRKDYVTAYAAAMDAYAYSGMQVNGSMEVSQELGSTANAVDGFMLDGWSKNHVGTMVVSGGQVDYGIGFPKRLNVTVTTAQPSLTVSDYVIIRQRIEGYRMSRLGWGAAGATPITICFHSIHTRTGLYSVAVRNGAGNRSYIATYTQVSSGAREYHTITIPGDTAGTWNVDNTTGIELLFTMASGAVGTADAWTATGNFAALGQVNGVTSTSDVFRLTCVVVLPGTQAPAAAQSPLIMRPYDQELATCQRYYRHYGGTEVNEALASGQCYSTTAAQVIQYLEVPMRSAPAITWSGAMAVAKADTSAAGLASIVVAQTTNVFFVLNCTVLSGLVAGNATKLQALSDINARLKLDARL